MEKKESSQAPDNRKILARFTNKQQKTISSQQLKPHSKKTKYCLSTWARQKNFPNIVSGTNTMNGIPYVWIKPTGRAIGGSSTRPETLSLATLKKFYNDTLDIQIEHEVNDISD